MPGPVDLPDLRGKLVLDLADLSTAPARVRDAIRRAQAAAAGDPITIDVDVDADGTTRGVRDAERLAQVDASAHPVKIPVEVDRSAVGRVAQSVRDLRAALSVGPATTVLALSPALLPTLAAATAAAGGLGVAVVSAGAALGVFGGVAGTTFIAVKKNVEEVAKGTGDLTGPLGRATLSYLAMGAAWERFVARNQPAIFREMGAGFKIVEDAIPRLQPLFDVASGAVARLESQLGSFVSGGGLDRMVGFLADNAGPALEAFRQTMTNLGSGLGSLAPQFARFTGGVEVGMVHLSAAFAHWAAGGGLQGFITYVISTGPDVVATLKNLASAAVTITQGLAPLGPVSLTFVGAMARLIAVLPPGAITAIAAGFISIQGAMKGAALASEAFNLSFGRTPIGVAAVALAGLIGLFVRHSQAVAETRQQVDSLAQSLDRASGSITAQTRSVVANNLQSSGALDAANKLGISLGLVTDAALGNQSALDQVNAAIVSNTTLTREQLLTGSKNYQQTIGNRDAAATLSQAVNGGNQNLQDAIAKQHQLAAATAPATVTILSEADAAKAAARAMETFAAAALKATGSNLSVAQSEIAFRDSLVSLTASVHDNGRSLDLNTVKGRANRSAVLASLSAALQHADAVKTQTNSQIKGEAAFEASIPAIRRQAAALGLNKAQVDALIASIIRTPQHHSTAMELKTAQAQADAKRLQGLIAQTHGKTVTIQVNQSGDIQKIQREIDSVTGKVVAIQVGLLATGVRGFSRGGRVTGGSPGRDSVPALLEPGEYVETREEADRLGRNRSRSGAPATTPAGEGIDYDRLAAAVARGMAAQAVTVVIDGVTQRVDRTLGGRYVAEVR